VAVETLTNDFSHRTSTTLYDQAAVDGFFDLLRAADSAVARTRFSQVEGSCEDRVRKQQDGGFTAAKEACTRMQTFDAGDRPTPRIQEKVTESR
jgi:hypothetical protein